MAQVVIAAASLAAVQKNFGPQQAVPGIPVNQLFATNNLLGGRYYWADSSVPSSVYKNLRIAENESPRPLDRVFTNMNYFLLPYIEQSDLLQLGFQYARVRPTTYMPVRFPPSGFEATRVRDPNLLLIADSTNNTVIARDVIGFEKTFLDGLASVQLRIPGLKT